jgi:hypothetical protein
MEKKEYELWEQKAHIAIIDLLERHFLSLVAQHVVQIVGA